MYVVKIHELFIVSLFTDVIPNTFHVIYIMVPVAIIGYIIIEQDDVD